jgi:hypothetical protein
MTRLVGDLFGANAASTSQNQAFDFLKTNFVTKSCKNIHHLWWIFVKKKYDTNPAKKWSKMEGNEMFLLCGEYVQVMCHVP